MKLGIYYFTINLIHKILLLEGDVMNNNNYLEEVKELLWSTWDTKEIEDEEFNKIKVQLNNLYEKTGNPECLWLLSELYVHKINSYKRTGAFYAVEGLVKDYNSSALHDNYNICSNGVLIDFKKRNHNDIIEFYHKFINVHPDSLIARRIMIENLIDNYRFDEASVQIEEAYKIAGNKAYLIEFYKGEILYKSGHQDEAIAYWKDICERNKDNYLAYFSFADELANFARYDDAIKYYKQSFDMQKSPRKIDALISMFQIYEIQKNYREALKAIRLILYVYEQDYGITGGNEIESYLEDKKRLEKIILTIEKKH